MPIHPAYGGAPEILCSRVTTRFDDEEVLSRLSLTVPAGKVTCLLGPSGCGKTTLLKHILGLSRPDDGMVSIGSCDVLNSSPQRLTAMYRTISSLHSGAWIYAASLYSSLSVRDNMLAVLREKEKALAGLEGRGRESDVARPNFGLWIPGGREAEPSSVTERELHERADEYLRRFRLVEVADLLPEELSARTLRRAAVARSLVADAAAYILDDPDTASDAPEPGEVVHGILDTHERTGATMLIATHDLNLAELVSDHIAVLASGRVVAQGDPREVLDGVHDWYRFEDRFTPAAPPAARTSAGTTPAVEGTSHRRDRKRSVLAIAAFVALLIIGLHLIYR